MNVRGIVRPLVVPLAISLFFLFDILAICRFKYIGMIPAQLLGVGIGGYFLALLFLPQFRPTVNQLIAPGVRRILTLYLISVLTFNLVAFWTVLVGQKARSVSNLLIVVTDPAIFTCSVLFLLFLIVRRVRGRRYTLDPWIVAFLGIWTVEYGVALLLGAIPLWIWPWWFIQDFIVYFCWLVMITRIIRQRYDCGAPITRFD